MLSMKGRRLVVVVAGEVGGWVDVTVAYILRVTMMNAGLYKEWWLVELLLLVVFPYSEEVVDMPHTTTNRTKHQQR